MRIKIDPWGGISYIYADGLPFPKIGRVSVVRASHVEFCGKEQKWYVYSPKGKLMIDHGFLNRADALTAERELLERTVLS